MFQRRSEPTSPLLRSEKALADSNLNWSLLLVDDGSADNTAKVIKELSAFPEVAGVIFSRNFGKEAAMLAGLHRANGDYVIIMDADLQHPPALIPALISRALETGADQIIACRDRVGEKGVRKFLSKTYYRMVNSLLDEVRLRDGEGDFRLLSRRARNVLVNLDERSRFSKGLFSWIGFPTEVIEYQNVIREAGESSWSIKSLFEYGLNGVLSFNTKPLRVVAYFGGAIFGLSLIYLFALIIGWLINGVTAPGYITIIASIIGFAGIQLLVLGVIGEYVGRIYQEVKHRPHYLVWEEYSVSVQD
ncbi:glycosyltransferase, group 2 family protein [Gleimia coleocanis DSM 15436]|uniref:Glycosyltransferase, group 2 family protein n=1 Tax=Gleimia coleocanis DSM 15436 TaxID=525245 RepID=C0VZU7_9ACTO|nr:glycosyltransferase family 2 protein [Gleimia coleocanis]EEH63806.1 glycosyltransferase, group 2 family protein [Gleimia coleocanis DSM 15436]